ncbi:hypothetical protein B0A55_01866 [Friedmanniomyces simplex]|uniref:Calcineurin-like phosphoesterase domain-containing protein n=1 Tax=Friedmanniomyces simplex TaxID=329884 RepID=A0A4U0XW02_9PEZI|nr:hypothetical protein B0A55_01866 [Friedmanniomyces simplex]
MARRTKEVSIQYMSDLHLERINYDFTIIKAAPILILGGDIGRFCDYERYCDFLCKLCQAFDLALLVAGNHEFYGSSREEGIDAAAKLVDEPSMHGKLHFLNRNSFDVPNSRVTILGCTLHPHIAKGYTRLTNDFARIRGWTVKAHNDEHERDLSWLKDSLYHLGQAKADREVVIVTHYAPLFKGVCHPLNENNAVSQCFSSHALDQVRQFGGMRLLSHWVFGHTHWNAKMKAGRSTILSNQLCNDDKSLTWWQRRLRSRPFDTQALIEI